MTNRYRTAAATHVFAVRNTHPLPVNITDPPTDWADRYEVLARQLVDSDELPTAVRVLRDFWTRALAADS